MAGLWWETSLCVSPPQSGPRRAVRVLTNFPVFGVSGKHTYRTQEVAALAQSVQKTRSPGSGHQEVQRGVSRKQTEHLEGAETQG